MKSRRHTVPIWKELNVFNTQILVWNKNVQNCRHSTKKYQYKKFLLRLYVSTQESFSQCLHYFAKKFHRTPAGPEESVLILCFLACVCHKDANFEYFLE